MKFILTVFIIALSFSVSSPAQADLLGPACVPATESFEFASESGRLFCPYLKSYVEGFEISQMLIAPMALIFLGPGARELIIAEMAAAGVSLANPVVLTVVGVSAGVAVTFTMWVRRSLAECEQQDREDLRRSLMQELESKYGAHPTGSEILNIRSY